MVDPRELRVYRGVVFAFVLEFLERSEIIRRNRMTNSGNQGIAAWAGEEKAWLEESKTQLRAYAQEIGLIAKESAEIIDEMFRRVRQNRRVA